MIFPPLRSWLPRVADISKIQINRACIPSMSPKVWTLFLSCSPVVFRGHSPVDHETVSFRSSTVSRGGEIVKCLFQLDPWRAFQGLHWEVETEFNYRVKPNLFQLCWPLITCKCIPKCCNFNPYPGLSWSLESAGEEYLLPLLRSIRWLMKWEVLTNMEADEDEDNKYQVRMVCCLEIPFSTIFFIFSRKHFSGCG